MTGTWNSAVKEQNYGVIILDLDWNGLIPFRPIAAKPA